MKVRAYAVVSFEINTDDGDPELIPTDQIYEAAIMALPASFSMEELLEWQPL